MFFLWGKFIDVPLCKYKVFVGKKTEDESEVARFIFRLYVFNF